ncbi:SDR family oxidoreductase [Phenylobacterium sp.]|uniref:SDR family NAD(P)-dependent oxidoreductase n=1 Tax=Phenylobacterium sp. TaxID=1871053 RepID=UPI00301D1CEF
MKAADIFDVRGRTVIVTGGAHGIGMAYAEALADNGARVTIMDLDAAGLQATVDRLNANGGDVRGVVVDVSDRPAVHKAFDETTAFYGKLDVAFLNAGINSGAGFITRGGTGAPRERPVERALENYDDAQWDRIMSMAVTSVFTGLKAAARNMKPQGYGRIIVTTSVASSRIIAHCGQAYMVAKAAAAHLVRTAALELCEYGIHVNAIAPGGFATNSGNGYFRDPKNKALSAKLVPLHRMGEIEEMQGVALLLASGASSFMVGSELLVDGGTVLGALD